MLSPQPRIRPAAIAAASVARRNSGASSATGPTQRHRARFYNGGCETPCSRRPGRAESPSGRGKRARPD
uniref:Uncharacterized protein n=1 Tax=uncultured marine microorganism HF4000_ANIW137J11 TaxID=455532 RepID=B3T4P1_9ZZZZ|nr:hypothetical protein ALOHA_HF4000ANIW137J11ctg1g4 [uncultured marine microorganism HF4000_ANIW137J11]